MKIPLAYQRTEYDCGPTTVMNALSCLFDREALPPDIMKYIMQYLLDGMNEKGEIGRHGTSRAAMRFLSDWLNRYGKLNRLPIRCEYISGADVFMGENSLVEEGLYRGGVGVARVMFDCEHYVLITGCDKNTVYLFDPYYRRKPFNKDWNIEMIWDKPTLYNRRVSKAMLNAEGKTAYAFSDPKTREVMMVFNTEREKPVCTVTKR